MIEKGPFKIEKMNHIAYLILNRPEKRNAMGHDFFTLLVEIFDDFNLDPEIRVVVIKAEGKSFTAGIDLMQLGSLMGDGGADSRENLRKTILQGQESMNSIERCTKPVIAAVHSHCIGGGVDLLSACDIRIASEDAVFSIRETRIGVIADVGTLQRLPFIIGHGWFRELALTGRDFSAEEALTMGFITRICKNRQELLAEADRLAAEIASCAPLTVQGTKDVILYSRDNGIRSGLQYVAQKNAAALKSEDLLEALNAFMEKRAPLFKGK
ncbi:crotonase/enoyl-CoA hydratase family protein [bacterium]|nr:crotonase/enoyl-CoA hydratase family protein [bacterium]